MRRKSVPHVSYDSLVEMYGALIGDAVLIQPVSLDVYDIVDVGYDMSAHFSKLYGTPLPHKDLTRRNLTLNQCVQHAEYCIEELRKPMKYTYPQSDPLGGARRTRTHGAAKKTLNKDTRKEID
jgi:hypothetical protein